MKKAAFAMLGCAVLVAGCVTTPKEDPVQLRLDDLDARVGRIDRIVSNQSLMQMASRIDTQQEEIRQLRGRLEELQNDNAKLRKEQRDLYADLDRRLKSAAATAASAATVASAASSAATVASAPPPPAASVPAAATAPGGSAAPSQDEQTLYNKALDQLRGRDYAGAVESFRTLTATYPNGQLADNTQYWLGETYYVTQEYDHAAAAFRRVLTDWPNARKAPDALLKLGYTQLEQGKLAEGRASLQQVVAKYPGTDPARLATERLAKLPKQ